MSEAHVADSASTSPPGRPVEHAPTLPVSSQIVALGSAMALTACLVAAAVVATLQQGELEAAAGRDLMPTGTEELMGRFVLGGLAASVLALLSTAWWLLAIRDVARWHAPEHRQRRSAAWPVLGWIVPIVQYWFPYQMVADASRAVGSRVTNFWPWWISWLVLMHGSVFFNQGMSFDELASAADVNRWVDGYQWGAAVTVVSFVLWWRIVRSATVAAAAVVTRA